MRKTVAGLAAGGLLLLVGSTVSVGSRPTVRHVHYVLPVGFRGEFRVYTRIPDGVEQPVDAGRCVVTVPQAGTLRVRGEGPYTGWHSVSVAYADGAVIPVANGGPPPPEGGVALRYSGANAAGFHLCVVGTAADYKAWADVRHP